MITILAVIDVSGVQYPSTPLPADAIAVVCDGSTYIVYEPGDTYPPVPPAE
jgi:hypothetical protein